VPSTNSFPTDRGTVAVVDGELVFEESQVGYLRSIYDGYWRGARWAQKAILFGYAFASLSALVFFVSAVWRRRVFLIATVGGTVALMWILDRVRGFRSADRIPLSAVSKVSLVSGKKGLTKPRLVIKYTDDNKRRKRRVNLPSQYATNGHTAYTRARLTLEERGFELS